MKKNGKIMRQVCPTAASHHQTNKELRDTQVEQQTHFSFLLLVFVKRKILQQSSHANSLAARHHLSRRD